MQEGQKKPQPLVHRSIGTWDSDYSTSACGLRGGSYYHTREITLVTCPWCLAALEPHGGKVSSNVIA
jgi:uncharacterized protein CbrC (UPF0167 family)